jgi:hypothetical protein
VREIDLKLLVEGELYDSFVAPFADVFKAGKLAAMGVVNPLAALAKTTITFSPRKMSKIMDNYKERQREIDRGWSDLNQRVKAGLGPDVQVAAFLLNPATFLGVAALKTVGGTAKDIALDATGLGPWMARKVGQSYEAFQDAAEEAEREAGRTRGTERAAGGDNRTVLDQLASIFFLAHHERTGTLLKEQAEGDEFTRLEDDLELLGAADVLQAQLEDWLEAKEEQVAAFNEMAAKPAAFIKGLESVESSKDLVRFLDDAVDAELFDQQVARDVKAQFEESAKKIAADEAYRAELPEGTDPLNAARETAVGLAKEQLKQALESSAQQIEASAADLLDDVPSRSYMGGLPQTPEVKKLAKIRAQVENAYGL